MLMSNEEYDTFHHNWMVCDKTFEVKENITEEQREKFEGVRSNKKWRCSTDNVS